MSVKVGGAPAVEGTRHDHPINRAVATTLFVVLCGAAAFAVVAVPLAMLGWFSAARVLVATLLGGAGLVVLARPNPVAIGAPPAATATAVAVVGVVTVLGLAFPSQHFATNRDPGVYATTGLWMENRDDLLFEGMPAVFDGIDGISVAGAGFYDARDDGRLYVQFSHLTHVFLGTAEGIGGPRALVRINVLVGAAALLALYALVQRLASGWAAVIATTALALSLPQIYFTRGPYSEPLTQLLLLGGLLIVVSRWPRTGSGLLAGLLLGAVVGSRIDGILVVCALVAVVLTLWLRDERDPRNRRAVALLVGGALLTGGIGYLDLRLRSPVYLSDLWSQFRLAALAASAMAVAGVVLVLARTARARLWRWFGPRRVAIADVAAVATAVTLLALLLVRPGVQVAHGGASGLISGLQSREGLDVDPSRSYAELSFVWITWYLGWPLVLASVAGASLAVRRAILPGGWRTGVVALGLGLPTLVYLVRPSIFPDQIWAMRRYLPFGLPFVCTAAALAFDSATRRWREDVRPPLLGRALALVVAAALIVPAAMTTRPFWSHSEHRLTISELDALCDALDGAPTLVDGVSSLGTQLTQPIAARCGVDVAYADLTDAELVDQARRAVQESGSSLRLVTIRPTEVPVPTEQGGLVTWTLEEVERTLGRPPSRLEPGSGLPQQISVLVAGS